MNIDIKLENVGKKYIISHEVKERYQTLRDTLTKKVKHIFKSKSGNKKEEFWAIKNINFEVKSGERLGIIGRNGAGKSTLLKVISRITEPTTGKLRINGRAASLLEVGTGFHPELTGRENIFLNGVILGMSNNEIKNKFDEIVNFAEVEKFLDTPVKRYSSGMYVRLAFAIAAHLDPDILLIDEVLAVGDVGFQKKCLGKMEEVSTKHGRTILFVSHNLGAIEKLCNKCLLLENGEIKFFSSDPSEIIKKYLSNELILSSYWENIKNIYINQYFKPVKFYIGDKMGNLLTMPVRNNDDFYIFIQGDIKELDNSLTVGFAVFDEINNCVFWSYQTDTKDLNWPELKKGNNIIYCKFPNNLLNEGNYRLELICSLHFRKWIFQPNKDNPSINLNIKGGLSESSYWMIKRPGIIAPILKWMVKK